LSLGGNRDFGFLSLCRLESDLVGGRAIQYGLVSLTSVTSANLPHCGHFKKVP